MPKNDGDHFICTEPLSPIERTWLEVERKQWEEADRAYNELLRHAEAMAEALNNTGGPGPNGPSAVRQAEAVLAAYNKWKQEQGG